MPWLTRICPELMRKPVKNLSWHPHLHILPPCRANSALLLTSTCPIPWPRSRLPSTPQVSTCSGTAQLREMYWTYWFCRQILSLVVSSGVFMHQTSLHSWVKWILNCLQSYYSGISGAGFCPAQKLSSKSLYTKEIALSASERVTAAS